jgi:hypothetical protein
MKTRKIRKKTTSQGISARDKYLNKKFCVSEKEFNTALEKQNNGCKICGRPPATKALHVDHDHAVERWKILSKKTSEGWCAWPKSGGADDGGSERKISFVEEGRTKQEARAKVKAKLKRLSARGILCWKCNTALPSFSDDPILMRKAADYLENYYEYLGGKIPSHPNFWGLND